MIKLEVKNYCQDCPDFEAVVERLEKQEYIDDPAKMSVRFVKRCDTYISCAHRERCSSIADRIGKVW